MWRARLEIRYAREVQYGLNCADFPKNSHVVRRSTVPTFVKYVSCPRDALYQDSILTNLHSYSIIKKKTLL